MEASTSVSIPQSTQSALKRRHKTSILALDHDILPMIFAGLDLVELIRCSVVCKSWSTVIDRLKLLRIKLHSKGKLDNVGSRSLNMQMEQLAMKWHRSSLKEGPVHVIQWKGHSVGVSRCRMKRGLILTGVGDKLMRLWSVETMKCLDEYKLPDKAPLIDFDFDEGKVVGLVGTRICIWTRTGTKNLFSSQDGMFTKGLCLCYKDPEAVVGCEDGRVRVFDMYSRRCSQIIKMHAGPVTCVCLSDDQLLISGSSCGGISMSDLSSDQRVTTLKSTGWAGIKTLCLNPRSHMLFAGSTDGYVSCWDPRTLRRQWETRVCPNVIYSMNHLKNDTSTLVVGGIDGVVRFVDQETGEVLSRCIMEDRNSRTIGIKPVRRLAEDDRVELMSVASRPPITSLAVGMQRIVTMNNDKCVRTWKFT